MIRRRLFIEISRFMDEDAVNLAISRARCVRANAQWFGDPQHARDPRQLCRVCLH
jgi:hypothetical protein